MYELQQEGLINTFSIRSLENRYPKIVNINPNAAPLKVLKGNRAVKRIIVYDEIKAI